MDVSGKERVFDFFFEFWSGASTQISKIIVKTKNLIQNENNTEN